MPLIKKTGTLISEQEYLEGEQLSELKHEYIDGTVYAMAGSSKNHELIKGNVFRKLANSLIEKQSPYNVFSSDMKVKYPIKVAVFFILMYC